MEPVLLPRRPLGLPGLRPAARAFHTFLAKPPARAGLEPASSPGKGSEPPAAPPAQPRGHRPCPSEEPRIPPRQPRPAAPPPQLRTCKEKTQSKPFPSQELELRSLGKTTLTAATFIGRNVSSNCSR